MANEVAKVKEAALPAHLQRARTSKIGNTDQSDLILPRVKLLQGISPELTTYDAAKAGEFWNTMADMSMGKVLKVVPIRLVKTIVLWAPRGDERGVLARSNDGITWDKPNEKFEVKLKNSPKKQVWDTGDNVKASGLTEFGSSIAEDPDSQPAAALTYNWLFYFLDHPDLSPAVVINTRSAVKPAKQLISKLEMGAIEPFFRVYDMSVVQAKNGTGDDYNNYQYTSNGYVEDPEVAKVTEAMYHQFREMDYRTADEGDDTSNEGGGSGGIDNASKSKINSKF